MIDIASLKQAIATAPGLQVGTYRFSNGLSTPAIRVDDGSDPYDEEPQIEGLEVVLVPNLEVPISLVFGGYQQTFSCSIYFKQWDILKTTIEPMLAVLPVLQNMDNLIVGSPKRIVRSTKLDNIETMAIPVAQSFLTESTFDE